MARVRGETFRSTSRKRRNSSTSLSRELRAGTILFGLFYLETPGRGAGAIAILAAENRNRVRRDQLIALEDELGIKAVAGWFVNRLSAEIAVELVFVIVIAAETQLLAIRRELLLFIKHDEL